MNVNDIKYKPLLHIILYTIFDEKFVNLRHSLEHPSVDREAYRPIWSITNPKAEPDRFYTSFAIDDRAVFLSFSEGRNGDPTDVKIDLINGELENYQ